MYMYQVSSLDLKGFGSYDQDKIWKKEEFKKKMEEYNMSPLEEETSISLAHSVDWRILN